MIMVMIVGAFVLHRISNPVEVPHKVLSSDGADLYRVTSRGKRITASAPASNHSYNLRVAFWPVGSARSVDQQSCVVWTTPDGRAQPGMSLRIIPRKGALPEKALVLTQNLWGAAYYEFFLLGIDGGDVTTHVLGHFNVLEALIGTDGKLSTKPWHVCVRVVGRKFTGKAWQVGTPEPSWTSSSAFSATIPEDWVYAGYAGSYIGHLRPGKSFAFVDLTTTNIS